MAPTVIQTMRESDKKTWYHGPGYSDGAIRFLSVPDLLLPKGESSIVVSQWKELDPRGPDNNKTFPKYAAISHTWTMSSEVYRLSSISNRPLQVNLEAGTLITSWHGLCQAAQAAKHLGCDYLWLDFLTLHQTSPRDKEIQIPNMGHIYRHAKSVIVMPGGLAAAQGADQEAAWITRAWTLQEAVINCRKTEVLYLQDPDWSKGPNFTMISTSGYLHFASIGDGLALSPLNSLLSCCSGSVRINGKKVLIRCFGEGSIVSSLQAILAAAGEEGELGSSNSSSPQSAISRSAIWRSIWMRSASKPQDMVFSAMHLLGVQIEVDYSRPYEDLIVELARKSASPPSWLDIGDDLPFDPRNGMVPKPPRHGNGDPEYISGGEGGKPVSVSKYVETVSYIPRFDINILPSLAATTTTSLLSDGDLVCASIFKVSRERAGPPMIFLGDNNYEVAEGLDKTATHVMIIGKRQCYTFGPQCAFPRYTTWQLRLDSREVWVRVGKAIFLQVDCSPFSSYSSLQKFKRSHLRIGGAPGGSIQPCSCPSSGE